MPLNDSVTVVIALVGRGVDSNDQNLSGAIKHFLECKITNVCLTAQLKLISKVFRDEKHSRLILEPSSHLSDEIIITLSAFQFLG